MSLSNYSFEELLPPYLTNTAKGRIRKALEQFFGEKEHIDYSDFYTQQNNNFLLQSDVVHSIVGIDWNFKEKRYETGFSPALLISNSCDVTLDNDRSINGKEAMFAPLISVKNHLEQIKGKGHSDDQVNAFYQTLVKQEFTNLFYLPPNPINKNEYIVRLDKIHWVPQPELAEIIQDLSNNRFISLSHWGYYLYLTKLSLHTCRVPEELERKD
jgi:hypothetical protein